MHKKHVILFFVLFFSACAMSQELKQKWASEAVFKVPESILYYPEEQALFVSNINGKPDEKDGNGFISKIGLDGNIIKLRWATGLNAPKGMAIYKNSLYVSDIDALVEIDLSNGMIKNRYQSNEAGFLNDVAVNKEGVIFVSDSKDSHSVIYCLKDGKFNIWMKGKDIAGPNGLYAENVNLIVGNSGDKKLKSINYQSREITTIAVTDGGIDGLKVDGKGNYIISDWSGKISLVGKDGKIRTLINTTPDKVNAADLEYIQERHLLFVPTFFNNRVVAYELIY